MFLIRFIDTLSAGIRNGLREVWAHKVRSFLSMIGIILGVAALVSMFGVVDGMIKEFRKFFEASGGAERVEIDRSDPPIEQQPLAGRSPGLTWRDLDPLRNNIEGISGVAPLVRVNWSPFRYGNRTRWSRLNATTADAVRIQNYEMRYGRFISDLDVEGRLPVVVISGDLYQRLFAGIGDPSGKKILIRGQPFMVIGVLDWTINGPSEERVWFKWSRTYIPATTAFDRFQGNRNLNEILLRVETIDQIPEVSDQVRNLMLQLHRGVEDFEINTQEQRLEEFKATERSFKLSLGGVAAISLFVGGIGIMNVMLATINERVREIGIRKALGARSSDIFIQFVAESLVISFIGGLIGLVASVAMIDVLGQILPDDRAAITLLPNAMITGFSFSVVIGVLAGIYPAIKASRLAPIEALRYE